MNLRSTALVTLCLLAAACSAPRPTPVAPDPLVVASDLANPPFAWVDDDGVPRGRDVEMMELVARALGRTLEWRRMPFDRLLDSAEVGAVDAVCATLGITAERARRVAFTRPYFETAIAVVVRVGEGEPASLADLRGRPVSAGRGTTSERAVRARLPHARPVLDNEKGLGTLERLLGGEVDAAVMDGPAADALVAEGRGRLSRLAEDLDAERYALAVPRFRGELVRRLDRALAGLATYGLLADLDRRHGLR